MGLNKTLARKRMENETTYMFEIYKMNVSEFGIEFDSQKIVHNLDSQSHAFKQLRKGDKIVAVNGIKCNTFYDILLLVRFTKESAIFSIYRDLSI